MFTSEYQEHRSIIMGSSRVIIGINCVKILLSCNFRTEKEIRRKIYELLTRLGTTQ